MSPLVCEVCDKDFGDSGAPYECPECKCLGTIHRVLAKGVDKYEEMEKKI